MNKILIIDDDTKLTSLLEEFLSSHKFTTKIINAPINVIDTINKFKPDLIILDITLPEIDGFQVLRQIREEHETPVIMLTARGEISDRVVGLDLGADDYMPKPFEPRELLARIHSILRRVKEPASMVDILEFDGLMIDKMKQEVYLDKKLIHLSTTEFEALVLIADHAGESLDREFLVENLRGIQWQSFDRSIDVLVSRLRNKLGETPENTRFIKTVHGVGYIFIATRLNHNK
ncbi:MAG: DNA-binding response regulator [Candidatus Marinimicrobia bacterium]|nr:DNA-binding response regulator [Candidatus Neomarinimicrobiota bacterium]|tara:strand:- start:9026 stop:9724 length:699 start_codon:yes stop_codon:yes gene_type:complete